MVENKDFRQLVRIMNTDLKGNKQLAVGLTRIKGVGYALSNGVCEVTGIPKAKKVGYLSDENIEKLNMVLTEPLKHRIPEWMLNRPIDPGSGEATHLLMSDLQFAKENDIKRLQKIKSNRGLRHQWGLPTRGQRTKAHFRKGRKKAKALGVKRKK